MNASRFLTPATIYYGEGALEQAAERFGEYGRKALVVTDRVMVQLGSVERLTRLLQAQGVDFLIFDGANTEPDEGIVQAGLEFYTKNGGDFLIALGGGSPIDAAKAIGALAANPGQIKDYMGLGKLKNANPPLVAIPTTAGTGSEATQFAVISDLKNGMKMAIGSPLLIPTVAVADPTLTLSVPPKITAATGIDALTHAVEAYTSRKNQPLADNFALSAIRRISRYLRRAWANGDDKEARGEMMLAAFEAGQAFSNSSVTIVHGMSHPLGALFHVAHGVSNAVLLPICMEYAVMGAPERYAEVARAMGVRAAGETDLELAWRGAAAVKLLCQEIEIPTLAELGLDREAFLAGVDKMADDALASGRPNNTARKPARKDLVELYRRLF